MNKITSTIKKYLSNGFVPQKHPKLDVVLSPGEYVGICPFQKEKFLERITLIQEILQWIHENENCLELIWDSKSLNETCDKFEVTPNSFKKNILQTLERIGLVIRPGHNWDYVCLSDTSIGKLDADEEEFEEFIRTQIRQVGQETDVKSAIERLNKLIEIWGGPVYWWEIWFCLRVDVDFNLVVGDVKSIRKMFGLSKSKYIPSKINEITRLFDEHNMTKRLYPNLKLVKGVTTIDFPNVRNMISNAWGNRFVMFNFKIQGKGDSFTLESLFSRERRKVKRTLTKDKSYLKYEPNEKLDNHHIIPHDYGHYLPEYHADIENDSNGILITKKDHNKFPKKDNPYVVLEVTNQTLIFKSYDNPNKYIKLEDVGHLDLEKIKKEHVPFNQKLVKKMFSN
jgi:hypothetical protein